MPSVVMTNQSGGQLLISGNFFSGVFRPQGGIQFRADRANSGSIYIGLSGGVTVQSGTIPAAVAGVYSGGGGIYSGALDGMQIAAGDSYWIPTIAFANKGGPTSGVPNIYAGTDAAASGQARLYFEVL